MTKCSRLRHQSLSIAVLTVVLVLLEGCVAFPIGSAVTISTSIERDSVQFIKVGRTTKAEINEQLGRPLATYSEPSRWVYKMRTFYPSKWYGCVAIPAGFGAMGNCGKFGGESPKTEVLYIRFDTSDTVAQTKTRSIYESECVDDGVCPYLALPEIYEGLTNGDGLYFEGNSAAPFTGVRLSYFGNGQTAEILHFRDGLEHGPHEVWYMSGIKHATRSFRHGEKHGVEIVWYESGQASYRLKFEDGLRHGLHTAWQPDGSTAYRVCYRGGEKVDLSPEDCES